jgi:hypothetical protein
MIAFLHKIKKPPKGGRTGTKVRELWGRGRDVHVVLLSWSMEEPINIGLVKETVTVDF